VSFESSGWDLKLVFGTLDQGTPDPSKFPRSVKYHTAINVPWKQAKLLAYSACMNVLWHERGEGKIPVASPPPRAEALKKDLAETSSGQKLIELDKLLRAVLFDEQA